MAVVRTDKTIRLSVGSTLTKNTVSNVKAAGDTGILSAINANLESILSGKLSTTDFNTKIAELKSQATQLQTACSGIASGQTAFTSAELSHFNYLKGKVDALPTNVYTDTLLSISTAVGYVKTKLDNLNVDLTPITSELNNADHGLSAIKNAISNIPGGGGGGGASMTQIQAALDALKESLQGADEETLTSIYSAIGNAYTKASQALSQSQENALGIASAAQKANSADTKLGTYTTGTTVSSKLDDISETIGDALDEVTGSAEGFVTNAELAGKVDEVKEAMLDALDEVTGDTSTYVTNAQIAAKVDALTAGAPMVEMTATTATIEPNKLYVWGEVSALTITLAAPTDTTRVNEYMLQFYSGATAATLTFTNEVQVQGTIGTNCIVSVSVVNNQAVLA